MPRVFRKLRRDLGQARALAAQARRGRFSLTHVQRIRRFIFFVISSHPIFYCIFAVVFLFMVLAAAGLLPAAAPVLVIALEFAVVWLGLAVDLVIAARQRELLTSIWLLLWVVGWGVVTLGAFGFVVSAW